MDNKKCSLTAKNKCYYVTPLYFPVRKISGILTAQVLISCFMTVTNFFGNSIFVSPQHPYLSIFIFLFYYGSLSNVVEPNVLLPAKSLETLVLGKFTIDKHFLNTSAIKSLAVVHLWKVHYPSEDLQAMAEKSWVIST